MCVASKKVTKIMMSNVEKPRYFGVHLSLVYLTFVLFGKIPFDRFCNVM